jgi:hypothetical protein
MFYQKHFTVVSYGCQYDQWNVRLFLPSWATLIKNFNVFDYTYFFLIFRRRKAASTPPKSFLSHVISHVRSGETSTTGLPVVWLKSPMKQWYEVYIHDHKGVSHFTLTVGSPLLQQPSERVCSYSLSSEAVTVASTVIAVQCISYASF